MSRAIWAPMTKRRDRPKVDGWLILDKPVGPTSTQALGKVRRLYGGGKAGHAGTLDPLASGILPIAFGEATKTLAAIVDREKTYRFRVAWGAETTTDDLEGAVTQSNDRRPTSAEIEAALPGFRGVINQRPPAFSAIKVDGERAYDLARAGEEVVLAEREVTVHRLDLLEAASDWADFEMVCGKGTYVRSLARDLARAIGAFGHVSVLRRTAVGAFDESRAISLDFLQQCEDNGQLVERLLPVLTALDDIPVLAVTAAEANLLRSGRSAPLSQEHLGTVDFLARIGQTVALTCDGTPVALGRIDPGEIRPTRVFNL
jgi:tRNA pseudouridine55 synthase